MFFSFEISEYWDSVNSAKAPAIAELYLRRVNKVIVICGSPQKRNKSLCVMGSRANSLDVQFRCVKLTTKQATHLINFSAGTAMLMSKCTKQSQVPWQHCPTAGHCNTSTMDPYGSIVSVHPLHGYAIAVEVIQEVPGKVGSQDEGLETESL